MSLSLSALALGGCQGSEAPSGADAATLQRLFPGQAAQVLEGSATFAAAPDGFSLQVAGGLHTVLPRDAASTARFVAPGGFEAKVHEVSATGAGSVVGHAVSYRRAGGTSYWTANEDGAEEWLLLDGKAVHRGAPVASWEVEGGKLRAIEGIVEIDDAQGVPRIRVTAPAAYAHGGRPVDAHLTVSGGRIDLSVDADGEDVLVDPVWTAAAQMTTGRTHFAAVLLNDGSVLVAGGRGAANTYPTNAERYNPLTNTWSAAGTLSAGREWIRATMMPSVNKVIATGGQNAAVSFANADIYDPGTNTWSAAAAMPQVRSTHTQTTLNSGKVLVANGNSGTAIVYDPAANTWTPTGAMGVSRTNSQAILLASGQVLVTGGNALASAELYDPAASTWSATGAMSSARIFHRLILLPSGKVLAIGGQTTIGQPALKTVDLYDPAAGTWSAAAQMNAARQEHTATLLPNGTVLVAGGPALSSTEIYDPAANTWTAGVSMNAIRLSHSATLLQNGSVFVASGGNFLKTTEYYSQGLGSSCTTDVQCPSGHCSDGVCCDAACNGGSCDACSVAAGAAVDGTCAAINNGGACDDADACTSNDVCGSGTCKGTVNAGGACNTGLLGACAAGTSTCVAGQVSCTQTVFPSPESCDNVDNDCNGTVDDNLGTVSCGDGACANTLPACTAGQPTVCTPQPDGTDCDDGNACTLRDQCANGTCVGGDPATCAAPDPCHLAGACSPVSGDCEYPNQPDGTACDDGVACTHGDACMDGSCVPTSPDGCAPDSLGVDVPNWASGNQPCTGNAPCDDGGIGPAVYDVEGVYSTELRPFVVSGSYSIAQCGGGLRPFDGGRVHIHSTNLTAFDLAGNDFDGNSLVETSPGWYGYMLQRDLITPGNVHTYIDYALDSARWDYQGSKSLILKLPGAMLPAPANAFTSPPTGDVTINLDKTNLVSVRFEVTSTTPCIGIDAVRFTASATDGLAIGSFASDSPVAGSFNGAVLSPDPAGTSGFVLAKNGADQAVATAEVLLEAGHLYHFGNAAVELTDPFGAPLSVVGIPGTSLAIPANQCASMVVHVSVAMPTGRVRGTMDFPNSGAAVDPSVKWFHASYFGATVNNGGNGQSAGYDIRGNVKRIATNGAAISYDYKAIVEGRWGARWPAWSNTALISWPAGTPEAGGGWGSITWPIPGGGADSVSPLDVSSSTTTGFDLDGYTYIDENDPVVKPIPNWPPQCPQEVFHTETLDYSAPMAFVGGNVHLVGCLNQSNIVSGTAGLAGGGASQANPATTFVDERGHQRTARVINQGGLATGVFATDGSGSFETAALQNLWQEGGYVLNLAGPGAHPDAGAYKGTLGFWKIFNHREIHSLVPGRANKVNGSLIQLHTGRIAARIKVKNEDGASQPYRPFRFPQAYAGVADYTDDGGAVLGQYYSNSSGQNVMQTEHLLELIAISHSVSNVRFQAVVPQNPDGTGRQFWVNLPMLRAIPFEEASCATCVTIRRGTNGTVNDAAIYQANPATNYGSAVSLYAGLSNLKQTMSLIKFDVGMIPVGSTVVSAVMTVNAAGTKGPDPVNVHRIRGAWSENTVKWNNFVVGIDGTLATTPAVVGTMSFAIKDLVQQWVSGSSTNYGVAVEQPSGGSYLSSSEKPILPSRPSLKVCFVTP